MQKGSVTVVDSVVKKSAVRAPLRSPFQGHLAGDRPARSGAVGVQLAASILPSVTLISTWSAGIEAMSHSLGVALGLTLVELPFKTGQARPCAAGLLMRVGPEEFLLVCDNAQTDMTAMLRGHVNSGVGSVTNLSQARCRIHVAGVSCLDALGKLFALDFRPLAFPVNEIRMSGHHHVPCTLHRLGATEFDLYVFSTYAHDQLLTLLDAALEYGVGLAPIE